MKNTVRFLGIFLFLAVIISGVSAGGISGGRSDGGGGGSGGTFTLTGIPSQYNGMYAHFTGGDEDISDMGIISWERLATLEKNSLISNGRVTLSLWTQPDPDNEPDNFVRYSGNHTLWVHVSIYPSSSGLIPSNALRIDSVKFTNGNATGAWRDGEFHEMW